ncbi:MAG: Alanine--tRNA ligase [Fimbriimonadaceae bacterium]|nr:Alanine--tRNA ligase [Fimbriimonadaceae bacterium]
MKVRELRQKYLDFFISKGHSLYPSGSLIPYDVTGRLDESLLFNGAGMVQFKPFFRGIAEPPNRRLTNAQKVVRTGDIESVGNHSHLTFFEMLGNFSFGDYFKQEAIAFSWEFLTAPQWLNLDPRRLAFTVFEEDDEAFEHWSAHLAPLGIEPTSRIFRLGEETNYWPAGAFSSGPPGPCGPNSEMFYWTSNDVPPPPTVAGGYDRDGFLRDDAAKLWLEIWNDVFIQYEWQGEPLEEGGYRKTGMPSLPFQSVDTGMGLERTATALGGYRSVYDTDAFSGIIKLIDRLSAEFASSTATYGQDTARDTAVRIIADHIRTASFCIADGILPSNTGRGYVLRRLIRRAVLKGQRVLGFEDLFLYRVVDGVVESLGDHYHELVDRRSVIAETLKNEEALFRRTLDQGSEILLQALARRKGEVLDGEVAFMLYDTYGFPLEVTQELCEEAGVTVDLAGYKAALAEAQERSRGADQRESVYGGVGVAFVFITDDGKATPTEFLGYSETETDAVIVGALPQADENGKAVAEFAVALNQTPFYAESGGQVADTGVLIVEDTRFNVVDVTKHDGVWVHVVVPDVPLGHEGMPVDQAQVFLLERLMKRKTRAVVDTNRRTDVIRNHTATHLLHAALRDTLGTHVTQAGSLVAPDHLRFDFTHGKAMSAEEISRVEGIVNEHVLSAEGVTIYSDVPLDEARAMGAMALFGEKYADRVRVVQVGDMSPDRPSFSRELCGGIHVRNTGQIGLFKILHESSAASGVRRVTAITGRGSHRWANELHGNLHEVAEIVKSTPKDLRQAVERLLDQVREERKRREQAELKAARGGGSNGSGHPIVEIGPVSLMTAKFEIDPKLAAQEVDDAVAQRPNLVVVAACILDGKVTFVAKAGPKAVESGAHAGNLVREVAKAAGGGGGGGPTYATAGGRDLAKVDEALESAVQVLRAAVDG